MEIYKLGSRGEGVKAIQRALHLIDDGVFGKLTREAVITFQKEHGLTADGIVGPATLAKLVPAVTTTTLNVKKSKRVITDIVVHCTASTYGRDLSAADIRKSHIKERGWADIGYHYVVRLDGRVEPGRDVDKIGAHVTNHNSHSIGVVYVGGLDKDGKAKDTRTELQKNALLNLLLDLRKLYPKAKISGHRDFSPDKNGDGIISPCEWIKSCPCFDAKREYARV
jgi:N-acetyl-anhydromuramyl-L-alanine amidase AmpD